MQYRFRAIVTERFSLVNYHAMEWFILVYFLHSLHISLSLYVYTHTHRRIQKNTHPHIRIPHPQGPLSITEDFRNAAELAQLLQVAARSNRLVGARALEISVESTILKLADLHVYAEDNDKGLQQCVATLKYVREELSGVWNRRRKLENVMTETEGQIEKWKL